MSDLTYDDAPYAIREDLIEAELRFWERLGRPGTWLDGETRLAIAAEARHARGCALCAEQKEALSPFAVDGEHDTLGQLPLDRVEIIHRIVSDPGRLIRPWYEKMIAGGVPETEYVEMVSIVAHITAVDTFAKALGLPPRKLPQAEPGEPARYRPEGAKQNEAWAPNIDFADHGPNEAEFFNRGAQTSNIRRALTLVPDEARGFFDLVETHYLPGAAMFDFSKEYRAITHAQIELLAGRVSALNGCTY